MECFQCGNVARLKNESIGVATALVSTQKDHILFINYNFPPDVAGVRRITKFVKYMPQFGFRPLVLAALPDENKLLDFGALKDIEHSNAEVYRCKSLDVYGLTSLAAKMKARIPVLKSKFDLSVPAVEAAPSKAAVSRYQKINNTLRRALSFPDDRFPWILTAIPQAEEILRNHPVKYVVTSSFPHSAHLIGLHLKQKFNIHWHADFRDGWMQNPYFADWLTPAHKAYSAGKEKQVVRLADSITAVSEPITRYLQGLTDSPEKVTTLPNGFDPADFDAIEPEEFDCYTVAYTGTMFMQRSPAVFFEALAKVLKQHPGLEGNYQVIFQSNVKQEHLDLVENLKLGNVVKFRPMGSYEDAIRLQKSADLLLVLEGESSHSEIMLTQKIFEYMAADKPVLAVAPDGALSDVVKLTGCGKVVSPHEGERVAETLFDFFMDRVHLRRNEDEIKAFSRLEQTKQLAKILHDTHR